MDREDEAFFESYKRLDKLCAECMGTREGVNAYLAELEKVPGSGNLIRRIKAVRHVRNQLAHELYHQTLSTPADLAFTEALRERILRREDPLSRASRRREPAAVQPTIAQRAAKDRSRQKTPMAIVWILVAILGLLCYIVTAVT